MTKYEYKTLPEPDQDQFDTMGKKGWLLCQIYHATLRGGTMDYFIFVKEQEEKEFAKDFKYYYNKIVSMLTK